LLLKLFRAHQFLYDMVSWDKPFEPVGGFNLWWRGQKAADRKERARWIYDDWDEFSACCFTIMDALNVLHKWFLLDHPARPFTSQTLKRGQHTPPHKTQKFTYPGVTQFDYMEEIYPLSHGLFLTTPPEPNIDIVTIPPEPAPAPIDFEWERPPALEDEDDWGMAALIRETAAKLRALGRLAAGLKRLLPYYWLTPDPPPPPTQPYE
jgi:hypothetical protein